MGSFSCKLTRFRRCIVARQQTLPLVINPKTEHAMPRSRYSKRSLCQALVSVDEQKKAVDRRKGKRAGIGYSNRCQNILVYTRA